MKYFLRLLVIFSLISCDTSETDKEEIRTNSLNKEKELTSIEETRTNFQKAIAEKRYQDLSKYATPDLISLTPVCGDWEEYKELVKQPKGLFSYDSIRMRPEETMILNDTIAYDFGTSTSYYTNSAGEPVEIKATFLAILKKDRTDGVWKLHREVATTNMGN